MLRFKDQIKSDFDSAKTPQVVQKVGIYSWKLAIKCC